jgi:hypothetical protein
MSGPTLGPVENRVGLGPGRARKPQAWAGLGPEPEPGKSLVSSGKSATKAANHRRAGKRRAQTAQQLSQNGHVAHAATIEAHVHRAVPLAAGFDASSLPAASGAYSAKVENKSERYGSKVQCSLTNLLGLGFQLVTWDGMYVLPC